MVCPYSLSVPGGVQGQALGLARALYQLGHQVTVVAPVDGAIADPGLPPGWLVPAGRSTSLPANGSVAPLSLHLVAAARAARRVVPTVDVVHLHEPLAPLAGYGLLLAPGPAKVGTFHRAGAGAGYRVVGRLARPLLAGLQVRCAVSEQAAATAAAAVGGRYEVVGNGLDLDRLAGAEPWPVEGPTVLFVGRHEPRKGLQVLLQATDALAAGTAPHGAAAGTAPHGAAAPLTLWIAGRGPDTDRLQRRWPATARRHWLGRVDDAELARRLAGAHVLCAPSLHGESFGVVLLEAMAAGCAVVASDLPGYRDVVGAHGTLVPPGDGAALARALGQVAGEAASATGRCAPEALRQAATWAGRWSMAAVAGRYVELYRRALGDGSRR